MNDFTETPQQAVSGIDFQGVNSEINKWIQRVIVGQGIFSNLSGYWGMSHVGDNGYLVVNFQGGDTDIIRRTNLFKNELGDLEDTIVNLFPRGINQYVQQMETQINSQRRLTRSENEMISFFKGYDRALDKFQGLLTKFQNFNYSRLANRGYYSLNSEDIPQGKEILVMVEELKKFISDVSTHFQTLCKMIGINIDLAQIGKDVQSRAADVMTLPKS